jgi:ERCC4-type nuclease
MRQMQTLNLPSLSGRPKLVRRWAAELEGIGVKMSEDAQKHFKTPIRLATADETAWLGIEGIGPKTVINIVKEING